MNCRLPAFSAGLCPRHFLYQREKTRDRYRCVNGATSGKGRPQKWTDEELRVMAETWA